MIRMEKISCLSIGVVIFILLLMPIGIGFVHLITPTYNFTVGISHPFYLILPMVLSICELSLIILRKNKNYIVFSNVIYICILLCSLYMTQTYILSVNATYIDRQIKTAQVNTVASNILNQVWLTEDYSTDKEIIIAGTVTSSNFVPATTSKVSEMTYGHFSEWGIFWENNYDNIKTQWDNIYSNTYGIRINWASDEKYFEIINTQEFDDMPIFPNAGSIKIIDDIIVVKLEENSSLPIE